MRINRADVAKTVRAGQKFLFEFDPRLTGQSRTDIDRRSLGKIRMPEFDRQLRRPRRPTVFVKRAQPHNEVMAVKVEGRRIEEEHLAHLVDKSVLRLLQLHLKLFGHPLDHLPKILESLRRGEPLRVEENFVLPVVQVIVRTI